MCCRVGQAKFVEDDDLVNEEEGIFRSIPQNDLKRFLRDPMTGPLFMKYICVPFFKENNIKKC